MKYFIDKRKSKIEFNYTLPNAHVDIKVINIKGTFKVDGHLFIKVTHYFKDKEKQVGYFLSENIIGTTPIENRKHGFGYNKYFDKTIIEIVDYSVFLRDDYLIEFDIFESNGVIPDKYDLFYSFIKTLDLETIFEIKSWINYNSTPMGNNHDILLDKFLHLNKLAFDCFGSNNFKGLLEYNNINRTNCQNTNDILKDIFNSFEKTEEREQKIK